MRKRMSIRPIVVGVLSLTAAACAQLPQTASVAVPPIPPGEARVWFYRDGGPYDGIGTPYLRMNEAIVGVSEPGGASYRDVPAGPYHITVDSYGKDFGQDKECPACRRPGAVRQDCVAAELDCRRWRWR
jgi:hypothetical protein